jgi:glycine/serine hydroxymethyltransferase
MSEIASLIAETLRNRNDEKAVADIRQRVAALCGRFPVYPTAH